MKLAVFKSDFRTGGDMIDRLSAEKLGIIFVGNGIYHAAVKDAGAADPVLQKNAIFYVLAEDLELRGFNASQVPGNVKVVTYEDVVDLMLNDYEKLVWV
ncbi:MAG TPA: DsrH/TusB family sulfur metabolism protein [Dissulfurispiraceae bacterium]|nr:DsrH/TusB family sulfur metabolism protein [Dissulfurispiraceae bacterium]